MNSFCNQCGSQIEADDKFCPSCGWPVSGTGQNAAVSNNKAATPALAKKSRLRKYFAVVFLFLLCISAISFIFRGSITGEPDRLPDHPHATAIYRGDAGRSGAMTGGRMIDSNNIVWKSKVGGRASSPAVADGTAFVIGEKDTLIALDEKTGAELWRYRNDSEIVTVPAISQGAVILGGLDGNLVAISASSGELLWNQKISGRTGYTIGSYPVFAGGMVIVSSWDTDLIALDMDTGEEKWNYVCSPTTSRTNGMLFSPAASDDAIFGATGNGPRALFAVDLSTGRELWNKKLGVRSSPSIVENRVYYSDDKGLKAVDAVTGNEESNLDASTVDGSYPAFDAGIIFTTGKQALSQYYTANKLNAIKLETGSALWSIFLGETVPRDPVVADGVLFYNTDDYSENDSLHAISAGSGETLWSFSPKNGKLSIPAISNSTVFLKDSTGIVYAISDHMPGKVEAPVNADIHQVDWQAELSTVKGMDRIENVYYGDIDGDGVEEAIVLDRMDGSGSFLSIYIYAYRENALTRMFVREMVPKGSIEPDFNTQSLTIKSAAPDGDEPNCCPRNFMHRTFTWSSEADSFISIRETLVPNPNGWKR